MRQSAGSKARARKVLSKSLDFRVKFHKFEAALNDQFVEREEAIRGIMLSVLSGKHIFFLSEPGTAKSALFKCVLSAFQNVKGFKIQLDKQTRKEAVVGPIKMSTIGKDKYEHNIIGYLPDAHLALIDEIWKANASILDIFLWLLDESREFRQGENVMRTPLIAVFAAANELPESDGQAAHYDRFLLRYKLGDIVDDQNFIKMLNGKITGCPNIMDISDLQKAREEVALVNVSNIQADLVAVRRKLRTDVGLNFSPRRWKESEEVLKASAWLDNRSDVVLEDFEVLQHIFWNKPEDQDAVSKVILGMTSPDLKKAMEIRDNSKIVYEEAMKQRNIAQGTEAAQKLKDQLSELRKFKTDRRIDDILTTVTQWYRTVLKECLGYDIK